MCVTECGIALRVIHPFYFEEKKRKENVLYRPVVDLHVPELQLSTPIPAKKRRKKYFSFSTGFSVPNGCQPKLG